MFRAALHKAGPIVLAVTVASVAGVYVGKCTRAAIGQYRHGSDMAMLQSRFDRCVARDQMFEESRAMDRRIQQELQSERDRLAEQAFYAYRELCRRLVDQEAARAFTASDTPGQKKVDDMMLLGSENIYADDYNAWADANAGEIETAQKRDKARMLIKLMNASDYSVPGSHLRWLYPDRSTLRDSGSTADSVVLREARADLLTAGLLKKEEEERASSHPPTQK